jgi:hypothetical protein
MDSGGIGRSLEVELLNWGAEGCQGLLQKRRYKLIVSLDEELIGDAEDERTGRILE